MANVDEKETPFVVEFSYVPLDRHIIDEDGTIHEYDETSVFRIDMYKIDASNGSHRINLGSGYALFETAQEAEQEFADAQQKFPGASFHNML